MCRLRASLLLRTCPLHAEQSEIQQTHDARPFGRVRRYHELSKEDMLAAGVPEPVADLQLQMYGYSLDMGCVTAWAPVKRASA